MKLDIVQRQEQPGLQIRFESGKEAIVIFVDPTQIMFPGDFLFELKATHGFPLDFALDRILNQEKLVVEWVSFIEAARTNGWWDFKTYEVLVHALMDAEVDRDLAQGILDRFKIYVVKNRHPGLN